MDFPPNVMANIFLFLDYKSLIRLQSTSKCWTNVIANDNDFWSRKFKLDFRESTTSSNCKEEYEMERKFRVGHPKIWKVFGESIQCATLSGPFLVFGTQSGMVRVEQLSSKQCVRVLCAQSSVQCIALHDEKVIVGLEDGRILVWDMGNWELCGSWQAHGNMVLHIKADSGWLVSAGYDDQFVNVWNMDTFEIEFGIQVGNVECICVHGNEIFVGLEDGYLHVYNMQGELQNALLPQCPPTNVFINSTHIFGSCMGTIEVWDRDSKDLAAVLGQKSVAWLGECDSSKFVRGSILGHIEWWDVGSLTCVRHLHLDVGKIACIGLKERKIVAHNPNWVSVIEFDL